MTTKKKPPSIQTISYFVIVGVILLIACLANAIYAIDLLTDGAIEQAMVYVWFVIITGPLGALSAFIAIRWLSRHQ